MLSQEISKRWVDFFAKRGHTVVPSTSLISNEPGAMFTIAGMVPFIPYFWDVKHRRLAAQPASRSASEPLILMR